MRRNATLRWALLLVSLMGSSGCVSRSAYDALQTRHAELEQRHAAQGRIIAEQELRLQELLRARGKSGPEDR